MEQLIIIGVLVVFSILNEIAKKKKKEAQAQAGGQVPSGLTPEELEWKWEPVGEVLPVPGGEPRADEGEAAAPRSPGDQGVIPRDIWEEIAALASGQPLPEPTRSPPPPPAPVPAARSAVAEVEDRRRERGPARPDHEAHLAHAKYGTPMSERLRPLDTPEMHAAAGPSDEVRSVLALLSGGGASLRQAIILQEVLGPPVALRDE